MTGEALGPSPFSDPNRTPPTPPALILPLAGGPEDPLEATNTHPDGLAPACLSPARGLVTLGEGHAVGTASSSVLSSDPHLSGEGRENFP